MSNLQVTVSESEFRRSHLRSPRGRGSWAFHFGQNFGRLEGSTPEMKLEFAPCDLTFTEARRWAVRRAQELGTPCVVVGS